MSGAVERLKLALGKGATRLGAIDVWAVVDEALRLVDGLGPTHTKSRELRKLALGLRSKEPPERQYEAADVRALLALLQEVQGQPTTATPGSTPTSLYKGRSQAQLKAAAHQRNIELPPKASKAQIVELLEQFDAGIAPDPAAVTPAPAHPGGYAQLSRDALARLCTQRGLDAAPNATPEEMVHLLESDDALLESEHDKESDDDTE